MCRAGLAIHPAYLSARVTLGRALIELNEYPAAQQELEQVLRSAPENLAAVRGLAVVLHRQGALGDALVQYRAALTLVRHDPDLQQIITDLERQVQPAAEIAVPSIAAVIETLSQPAAQEPTVDLVQHTPQELPQEPQQPQEPPLAAATIEVAADSQPAPVDSRAERERRRTLAILAALEQWLAAVHVARAQRCA